ncbi:MAG: tetratricopeptide repeat protein [Nitrospiria bacterium]
MMRAAGGLGPPAVLLAVTAALYAGVITHPFEYDDFHSLVENGAVHGFGRFAALWTSPTAVSAEGSPGYRPVLLSVWALQHTLFGLNPAGYHVVNLLMHLGVVVLTWRLAALAYGSRAAALVAAALVALHPLHVEAVNYIAAQSSLLVTLCMVAALVLTTEGAARRGTGRSVCYAGSVLAAGLALGVKEIAVVFPVLFWLWERLRASRGAGPATPRIWVFAFWGLALGFVALRQVILTGETLWLASPPPPVVVAATTMKMITWSLWAWLWPFTASVDHGDLVVSASQAWIWVLGGGLTLVSALVWARRGIPAPFTALAWTAASILPVGAVVLVTRVALFQEHRAYTAGVGLALVSAPFVAGALRAPGLRRRRWTAALAGILVLTAAAAIVARTHVWADRVALWSDALAKYPESAHARSGLVAAYLAAGRVDLAEASLRESASRAPDDPQTVYALADLLMKTGRWAEGQALNERIVEARIGRAGMAFLRGDMLASRGNWDAARRAYLDAEGLGGRGPELDARLGAVAERMGNRAEALTFYRRAATEMATTDDEAAWRERARAALARLAETGS